MKSRGEINSFPIRRLNVFQTESVENHNERSNIKTHIKASPNSSCNTSSLNKT